VNKKILGIVFSITMLAILVAPVMAGKGQTKMDFRFVLTGSYGGAPAKVIETEKTTHYFDLPFANFIPIVVEIDGVPIPSGQLSYTGLMHVNSGPQGSTVYVEEIITIVAGSGYGAGTLVLRVQGNQKSNGEGAGVNFNGYGTGAYEGVKISGISEGPVPVGDDYELTRSGTIMGWP